MYICIFYYIERVLNVNFLIQLDIDVIFWRKKEKYCMLYVEETELNTGSARDSI